MNVVPRRGACPALSAPMQTGDGLLVRLNPVAGGLSPATLVGLCQSASKHGNGIMEVTARGSIQIRGLTPSSARKLAADVDALGLAVRTGVPVETGPLAGLDPDEIADPRPLAGRIGEAIAVAGLASRLGPKVSVVVDGGGRLPMRSIIADVRLTAARRGQKPAWRIAIAGDAATAKALGTVSEKDAPQAVLEILEAIARLGPAGRAATLSSQEPSLPDRAARDPLAEPSYTREGGDSAAFIDILALSDATHALCVALPFGSTPSGALAQLAREALTLGAAEIRPAPGRALIFLSLSEKACRRLGEIAAALGFVTDPADPRMSIAACPGKPACASGRFATRSVAEEMAAQASDLLDGSFILHISGCAKGCAHPGRAALTLVGGENGAGLVVEGTARTGPAGYSQTNDPARALGRVAALVRGARYPHETAADCLARLGAASIETAFARE